VQSVNHPESGAGTETFAGVVF